ncbi:uncharacterized protein SCHCODRAFT_02671852 [Schizophyllum commune H4-8]|uniref:Uncharacterized protein n=1 Tax=Schizophyllum commune (strain H4-8 / FGSC 9210) TaxID=578458 RepID=D8QG58_SCHCM|nr:uncharacterized protein SCHCODRAFT_02671852 [Schizophyllum commune H4-8]KAI5887917.1 hypothetical protein SCHCODRAFT_02671852 [Schizophyllum commune H4-8]
MTTTSFLERAPQDIIREIALLGAASVFDPQDIVSLLLTSSKIHSVLNIRNCPRLYATVFLATYGGPVDLLPYRTLAEELVRRCTLLRRLRKDDMTSEGLKHDLQTAVGMLLENNPRAHARLTGARFFRFVWTLWQTRHTSGAPLDGETAGLALVALSLTMTHGLDDLVSMSVADRRGFMQSLADYFLEKLGGPLDAPRIAGHAREGHNSHNISQASDTANGPHPPSTPELGSLPVHLYSAALLSAYPVHAALQLYCAAHWVAAPPAPPPRLPTTRASAVQVQWPGPTQEDCREFALAFRTPLFADVCDRVGGDARSGPGTSTSVAPGSLTGVWEGCLMILGGPTRGPVKSMESSSDVPEVFDCIRPLQFELQEYLSNGPEALSGPLRCLRKVEPRPEHAEAWGAYAYAGDVQDDGLVQLIRQPATNTSSESEAEWLFSGRVLPGGAFVGCYRVLDGAGRGVFSMCRRA